MVTKNLYRHLRFLSVNPSQNFALINFALLYAGTFTLLALETNGIGFWVKLAAGSGLGALMMLCSLTLIDEAVSYGGKKSRVQNKQKDPQAQ